MDFYIIYLFLSLIPIWFVTYSTLRIIRHYRDGFDRKLRRTKYLYLKIILTLLMFWITNFHLSEVLVITILKRIGTFKAASILIFIGFSSISWIVSCAMVYFEFTRSLPMSWTGHRSFWVAYSLLYTVLLVTIILLRYPLFENIAAYCFYAAGSLCTLLLAFFAFFRPNEFPITNEPLINHENFERRRSTVSYIQTSINTFTIKIREFKTKFQNGKQFIWFSISVKLGEASYHLKRTYLEFDRLHRDIVAYYPAQQFPNLQVPPLPVFNNNETIDRRMIELESYLNELKTFNEFMVDPLINFLEIPSPYREEMLGFNREVTADEILYDIESSPNKTIMSVMSVNMEEEQSNTKQVFLKVKVPFFSSTSPDDPIYYTIHWETPGSRRRGKSVRRFREFRSLHLSLKRALSPAHLPKFPRKNYLNKLIQVNKQAVERRRSKLEEYLATVCNDVAFHCDELFLFLNCFLSPQILWSNANDAFMYTIIPPGTWETVIDKDSFYQIFHFKVGKSLHGAKVAEWVCSRRYNEFYKFQQYLIRRSDSPSLVDFNKFAQLPEEKTVQLPPKTLMPLVSYSDIEERCTKLSKYMEEVIKIESIRLCYRFRSFINEPDC